MCVGRTDPLWDNECAHYLPHLRDSAYSILKGGMDGIRGHKPVSHWTKTLEHRTLSPHA